MTLRFSEFCVDAADPEALAAWWSAALGWPADVEDDMHVVRPPDVGAPLWTFIAVPEAKTVKNRVHFDFVPDDQQAEVDRLIALGARHVDVGQGEQSWVVLADPEGNEFCVLAAR
ncbi:VOC family protein [Mycolicibacterium brumae]|uniref:Glyoxalase n=1 Tax=Mycolicibacterium brumae TaxID=85968 RepID=A0A2G5PEI0_9MYCO|nr:VOC family protein [Mycolicibacterium brumae]MCV7192087.1 VOC family protein [Mycolicibacterium brumae]PIB76717.1 glyoxalase [Mycolicibacterium brumae]RWA20752.1 hypothetical protein MBRU_03575 [Mycolicibacterium brumae DSM 44177]UWW07851.1 VOC family protein [Mycolicibacterium brumae]